MQGQEIQIYDILVDVMMDGGLIFSKMLFLLMNWLQEYIYYLSTLP